MAKRGAGGTSGGVGEFFTGLVVMAIGVYLFLSHVVVTTNYSSMWGGHSGLLLLSLAVGLALLFFSRKSWLGWLITLGSIGLVVFSIISNLNMYFGPTSLFRTVAMLTTMCIGFFMMVRSFRPK